MLFYIVLVIMITAGILGGIVNYLLPANKNGDGKIIQSWDRCIVLGIGATVLVPLFLEIAQSKLLDNIHTGSEPDMVPIKTYLLFTAYCFLAAAAGFRFINNILDSVLKDKQIASLKQKKAIVEKQKNDIEKVKEKLDAQNSLAAKGDEEKAIAATFSERPILPLPKIGPVTHPDDPQKGRFGGNPVANDRKVGASVKKSIIPGFYDVTVWVESTDPQKPLDSDVIFYLHDSFRPSVYAVTTSEFVEGKAVDDEIRGYGAFTVGAVADNGRTLLELDLAEQPEFPKEFRDR